MEDTNKNTNYSSQDGNREPISTKKKKGVDKSKESIQNAFPSHNIEKIVEDQRKIIVDHVSKILGAKLDRFQNNLKEQLEPIFKECTDKMLETQTVQKTPEVAPVTVKIENKIDSSIQGPLEEVRKSIISECCRTIEDSFAKMSASSDVSSDKVMSVVNNKADETNGLLIYMQEKIDSLAYQVKDINAKNAETIHTLHECITKYEKNALYTSQKELINLLIGCMDSLDFTIHNQKERANYDGLLDFVKQLQKSIEEGLRLAGVRKYSPSELEPGKINTKCQEVRAIEYTCNKEDDGKLVSTAPCYAWTIPFAGSHEKLAKSDCPEMFEFAIRPELLTKLNYKEDYNE